MRASHLASALHKVAAHSTQPAGVLLKPPLAAPPPPLTLPLPHRVSLKAGMCGGEVRDIARDMCCEGAIPGDATVIHYMRAMDDQCEMIAQAQAFGLGE